MALKATFRVVFLSVLYSPLTLHSIRVCNGGELADRISKAFDSGYIITEAYVADIMRQLLEAVNYFHSKRVAHKCVFLIYFLRCWLQKALWYPAFLHCRDLKPENVLFQCTAPDAPIKIIDFGKYRCKIYVFLGCLRPVLAHSVCFSATRCHTGLAEMFTRQMEYSKNVAGTVRMPVIEHKEQPDDANELFYVSVYVPPFPRVVLSFIIWLLKF